MSDDHSGQWQAPTARQAAAALGVVLLLSLALVGAVAPAGAQDDAGNETIEPYYGNASEDVGNEPWMEGNEDGSDPGAIFTYLGRVGTYVIGGDGTGSGPLLTGMLLLGAMLGLVIGVPVGMVGGSVLAVLAVFGVVALGLAPAWLLPVLVFSVGMLVSTMARGVFR